MVLDWKSNMTDVIGYINIFSGVTLVLTSLIVLTSLRESKVRLYYAISSLFLGLWSLSIYFYTNPIFFDTTMWLKIVYTMAYCMTLGLILFATVYPKDARQKFKVFFWIIAFCILIMTFVLWKTDLIVVSTQHIPDKHNTIAKMGPLYLLYGIPELITAIYVVGYYIKQAKILSGIEKRQVEFYFTGGIFMLIPVFVLDFVLPLIFKNTMFYKYSTIGNVLWTVIVGYSIFTTRFLDMRLILGSVISVFVKGVLIFLLFFLQVSLFQPLWEVGADSISLLKLFIFSVLSAIILIFLFKKIDQFLEEKIVFVKYNPTTTLRDFINNISKTLEIGVISRILLNLVYKSFHPSFLSIVLFDSSGKLLLRDEKGDIQDAYFSNIHIILESWKKLNSNRVLIYSELKRDKRAGKRIIDEKRAKILLFMEKYEIEIIFSLREEDRFDGVFMVGQSPDKGSYSVGDIDFLDSLVQNANMGLARAVLYLELSDFNKTLKQKVNEQTQELQQKVLELEEARRKERDMIDIMGHELRTPATIVKLNAELLEKYIESNPENFKKYLDRIQNSIENEIRLIDTLLSSAKLEGQKIEMNKERVSVPEQIEVVLHGYEYQAEAKGLKLISDIDEDTKDVYADKVRVGEIIDNLVSNAIKYTDEGSIIVKTESTDDHVKVSVIDTGKGIPEEEIPKLGTKFHRIEHYISGEDGFNIVRPGGTGLGLYVVYALVEMMGGKIWVDTEVGKGTTFFFTLPVYKGQREDIVSTNSKNMFDKFGLKK